MPPISSCRARNTSSIKIDEIDPFPGTQPKLDETEATFDVVGFSRFGVVHWALHIDAVNGPLIGPLEFAGSVFNSVSGPPGAPHLDFFPGGRLSGLRYQIADRT
jgi:hypothetical protein